MKQASQHVDIIWDITSSSRVLIVPFRSTSTNLFCNVKLAMYSKSSFCEIASNCALNLDKLIQFIFDSEWEDVEEQYVFRYFPIYRETPPSNAKRVFLYELHGKCRWPKKHTAIYTSSFLLMLGSKYVHGEERKEVEETQKSVVRISLLTASVSLWLCWYFHVHC